MVAGAGHVGMMTAARLAEADVFEEIVLVDVVDGLAAGIALDLMHTAGLAGFRTRVTGAVTVEEAGPADYVVITAGRARQPGMSRGDLVNTNAAIVGDIASRVAVVAPGAVLLVVTNPLDEMTQHAWRASGLPSERVIGMAGVLDTARFRALAAQAAGLRPDQIQAVALGSHGAEMVIPLSQASVAGRPITEVLGEAAIEAIVNRTRDSGAEVVSLLKQGSAFMAPGASAARMILAMAAGGDGDGDEPLAASVLADGSYGIEGVYLGLPVRLGPGGVREIVELPLTSGELAELRRAADRIRLRLPAVATVPVLPAVAAVSALPAVAAVPAAASLAGVS
jgi:malate dehydrogenase